LSTVKKSNKGVIVYQSNGLTEAKYEFSLLEKKAFLLVLNKIRETFIDTDSANKDLFHNLIVEFRPKDVQFESGKPSDIYNALKKLMSKIVEFKTSDYDYAAPLLSGAHHYKKEGYFKMTASKDLVYHIVDVAKQYTAYSLDVAMSFKSIYSVRFYEWLNQWKLSGGMKLSIKEIKARLMIENKYPDYFDFKKRVIDVAHSEMKSLFSEGMCDLYFEYSEYKEGRRIAGISIKIFTKQAIMVKPVPTEQSAYKLNLGKKEFNEFTAVGDLYNDLMLMTENDELVSKVLKLISGDSLKTKDLFDQILVTKAKYELGQINFIKAYVESILNKLI
jgi:plasmid replication initiation protein